MTFITDTSRNLINISKIAKAVPSGEHFYNVENESGQHIATIRKIDFNSAIINTVPVEGFFLVEKTERDGKSEIILTPIIFFAIKASGNIMPITNSELDYHLPNKYFWKHRDLPMIISHDAIYDNEEDFLNFHNES